MTPQFQNGGNEKQKFCKMIPSKNEEGTESCDFIGFVEKKLFRFKVNHGPKSLPLPGIGLKVE